MNLQSHIEYNEKESANSLFILSFILRVWYRCTFELTFFNVYLWKAAENVLRSLSSCIKVKLRFLDWNKGIHKWNGVFNCGIRFKGTTLNSNIFCAATSQHINNWRLICKVWWKIASLGCKIWLSWNINSACCCKTSVLFKQARFKLSLSLSLQRKNSSYITIIARKSTRGYVNLTSQAIDHTSLFTCIIWISRFVVVELCILQSKDSSKLWNSTTWERTLTDWDVFSIWNLSCCSELRIWNFKI